MAYIHEMRKKFKNKTKNKKQKQKQNKQTNKKTVAFWQLVVSFGLGLKLQTAGSENLYMLYADATLDLTYWCILFFQLKYNVVTYETKVASSTNQGLQASFGNFTSLFKFKVNFCKGSSVTIAHYVTADLQPSDGKVQPCINYCNLYVAMV